MNTVIQEKQAGMIDIADIEDAHRVLSGIINHTSLHKSQRLSEQYQANIYLKREDLQIVRSFKIRGAYYKIACLTAQERINGIVCASAGNHAQGVAYACAALNIKGTIFMPTNTPRQKVERVKTFGKQWIDLCLVGQTFDEAYTQACHFSESKSAALIHPFDDPKVMAGQATVGVEILADMDTPIDYLFFPIGGGGLASGVATWMHKESPTTQLIGVEPSGAAAMQLSLAKGINTTLDKLDTFVDGAAVKRVGENTFPVCQSLLNKVVATDVGCLCSNMLTLYNDDGIIVEPAGALSIAALEQCKDEIKGKTVVCLVSGGNNDIKRLEDIRQRSMLFEGLRHYFIVNFNQQPGALKSFLMDVLGPEDDLIHIDYTRKNNQHQAPVVIGIEVKNHADFERLMLAMEKNNTAYEYLNDKPELFQAL